MEDEYNAQRYGEGVKFERIRRITRILGRRRQSLERPVNSLN